MYLPTMPEVCEFKSDLNLMGTYYSKWLILCLEYKYNVYIHIVCENNHRFLVIADDVRELLLRYLCEYCKDSVSVCMLTIYFG